MFFLFIHRISITCLVVFGFAGFIQRIIQIFQMQVNIPYMDSLGMNKTPVA